VLENNVLLHLADVGDRYPVYLDGAGPLFIEQVNQLTDTIASGNTDGR